MDSLQKEFDTINSISHNFKHISYKEKITRAYDELINTDPTKIIKRGWEERDNVLGGIYGGKVYVIGADTGIGKTTFVNQVCNNIANTGVRVIKYSLEDRMEDMGKEELYYQTNRLRYEDNKEPYEWIKFVNNEYTGDEYFGYVNSAGSILLDKNIIELDKQKQVNIDELVYLMEEECIKGARVFAIDHLHYFEFQNGGDRLDLQIQNVMHKINEIARKYNVAILLVAHYRNNKPKLAIGDTPDYGWFKDGASIKQVANVIIQIERINDISYFYITKLRGPIKPTVFESGFNLKRFEYDFKKSEEQIRKEKTFIS